MTTGRTAFNAYWHAFGEGTLPWDAIMPAEKERWARMETEITGISDSLEHRRYVEDELDALKNQVAILTRKTEMLAAREKTE